MPSDSSVDREEAFYDYLSLMQDSGYDVIDLPDLEKCYPDLDCVKLLRAAGYYVEEDMVFLRYG